MKKIKNIRFLTVLLTVAMVVSAFSGCANKLPAETTPSTIESTTEETTETTLPTPTPEPLHGPFSTAVVTEKVVEVHGQLSVKGTDIVDQNGEPIQLKGMSSYGLHATANFFNKDTVQTLAEDWGCDVIRLAMYTSDPNSSDTYLKDPEKFFNMVCKYVDLCIDQGVYVIIDWHILSDGDPMEHKDEAVDFFSRMSAIYADSPNVIYEICNEPNGQRFDKESKPVDWKNSIRPYAESVIKAIRANDPDNIIIVGTPNWSQFVDEAAQKPLKGDNIMYTLHFYAGSHGQELKDRLITAHKKGLPIFVTEWGTTDDSGKGIIYMEETESWLALLDEYNISWCNWFVGGSNMGSTNALKFFNEKILTIEEKYAGHWPDEFLTESGLYVREKILDKGPKTEEPAESTDTSETTESSAEA